MPGKCAVTRVYEAMNDSDREVFRTLITDTERYSGGRIAEILRYEYPVPIVDHHAVDHFRRKLRAGKATL